MSAQWTVPGGTCHVGDLHVTGEEWISGTVEGRIVVEAGGTLALTGIVTRGVVVEPRGIAYVTGTVGGLCVERAGDAVLDGTSTGDVENWGRLIIAGMVDGEVVTHPGAATEVSPGAVVQAGQPSPGHPAREVARAEASG
ncbi:MAG TPA: polymer-forming cytoskeletal protein [Candidatus Dormibacteraeota bacterium]